MSVGRGSLFRDATAGLAPAARSRRSSESVFIWEMLVDFDMTLGGEEKYGVSTSCLMVSVTVLLSMEGKYGDQLEVG